MNRMLIGLFATMGVVVLVAVFAGVRVLNRTPEGVPERTGPRGTGERPGRAEAPMADPRVEVLELRKEVRELRGQMEWLRLKYEGRGPAVGASPPGRAPIEVGATQTPAEAGAASGPTGTPAGTAPSADFSGPVLSGQIQAQQSEIDALKAQVKTLSDLADQQVDATLPSLTPQALIERGKLAQQSGRSDLAHRYFAYFLQKYPNDPGAADAVYTLGQDSLSLSKPDEAIDYFERLRRDFPDFKLTPYAYFYLGIAHGEKGNLDEAVRFYQESIPRLSDNSYYQVAALYNIGDLYLDRKDRTTARTHFQRIVTEYAGIDSVKSIWDEATARLQEIDAGK